MEEQGPVDFRPSIEADIDLVRRVVGGSEDALATLYDRFAGSVLAVARRLGADHHAAEEVVQETFLVLWNRAELFNPQRGSVQSWLLAIARNRTIDVLRARTRRVQANPFSSVLSPDNDDANGLEWLIASGEMLAGALPEPGPEHAAVAREERAGLATALGWLEASELTPIVLAYRDGLSQSEIAAVLDWPLGTVKTRTRRGLLRLREVLVRESEWRAASPEAPEQVLD